MGHLYADAHNGFVYEKISEYFENMPNEIGKTVYAYNKR